MVKGQPRFAPRRPPRLLHGKKGVDDAIDGTYQRQSCPVARPTGAKSNGSQRLMSRGFLMTMRQAGWRYAALILGNRDHVSTCQKAQMPLRKVADDRSCLETSGLEGKTRTALNSKAPKFPSNSGHVSLFSLYTQMVCWTGSGAKGESGSQKD